MTTDLATLGIEVRSNQVVAATRDLRGLQGQARATETATGRMARETQLATARMDAMRQMALRLGTVLAAAFSIRNLVQMADSWSTMQWRIRNATDSAEQAAAVMERISRVARNTWSSLDQTTESFLRQESAMSALGFTMRQQLDHVEALNASLLISGLRGARAQQVADAWARAMARGTLRGEEFNSVTMNASRLTQALADHMGVSVVELRSLAEEGKITSDVMFGIVDSLEDLRSELEGDATLVGSLIVLGNALTEFVGEADGLSRVSSTLGSAIVAIADNLDRLATYAAVAAVAGMVAFRGAIVAAATATWGFVSALVATRAAMIRTGIGALIIGAGELVYQFSRLVESAGSFGNAFALLGELGRAVWDELGQGGEALGHLLAAAAWRIAQSFVDAFKEIADEWDKLVNLMADSRAGRFFGLERSDVGGALGSLSDDLAEKAAESLAKAQEIFAGMEGTQASIQAIRDALDAAADAADKLGGSAGGAGSRIIELGDSAQDAARKLSELQSRAENALAALWPEEAMLRDLEHLRDLFAQFGDQLDPTQRRAIEFEIRLLESGVTLEEYVADAESKFGDLAKEIENTLGQALADVFSSAIEDTDDLVDRLTRGFARLAEQQIAGLFDGMFGQSSEGAPNFFDMIGGSVERGAQKGSQSGILGGFNLLGGGQQPGGAGGPLGGMAQGPIGAGVVGFSMGYQSQNPVVGAVGGALSGFMMSGGNPIGAVIGGIAGALGGIFGSDSAKEERRNRAADQWRMIEQDAQNFAATLRGAHLGEITSSFDEAVARVKELSEAARAAGEDYSFLEDSFNEFRERVAREFGRVFPTLIDSLSGGRGFDSAAVKAQTEVLNLRDELLGFIEDVHTLTDLFGEELLPNGLNLAYEAARDMALSLLSGAEELTAVESGMASLRQTAQSLHPVLQELGWSAEEAGRAIETHLTIGLQKLRDEFVGELERSINELSGDGHLNELTDALERYNTRLRDAHALGLDGSLALQELNLAILDIAETAGLSGDQLKALAEQFPSIAGTLLGLSEATPADIAAAEAEVERARAELRRAYEQEIGVLDQTISRMESFTRSLRSFRDGLRLDSQLSPLSPFERLMEAQRQFFDVSDRAMEGDEQALGDLQDISRAYLMEAREYYGSSQTYFRIFEEVERILDSTLAKVESELDVLRDQRSLLEDQVSALIDIDQGVMSVAEAIANLESVMANLADLQQKQQAALDSTAAPPDPITQLYHDIFNREPDPAGHAYWTNLLMNQGASIGDIRAEMLRLQADGAMRLGGIVGYAGGGLVGNGIWDVDSVLARFAGGGNIALAGGEFVSRAPSVNRETLPVLDHINRTGRAPGNDNGAVVSELRELRQEVAQLRRENTRVTMAAAQEVAGVGRQTAAETSELNRTISRNDLKRAS